MAEKQAPAKAKRGSKTAAERAQGALDTRNRVVKAIEGRLEKAKATVAEFETELAEAKAQRDYAALHPALPKQPEPEVPEPTGPEPTA